jgi:hypothetical protein
VPAFDNPAAVLEIVNCSLHLQGVGKKDASYIAGLFDPHLDNLDPNKTLVDLSHLQQKRLTLSNESGGGFDILDSLTVTLMAACTCLTSSFFCRATLNGSFASDLRLFHDLFC